MIDADDLHDNMDYTPYQGTRVQGWPTTVLSRGEVVCDGGKLVAPVRRGRFLRCSAPLASHAAHPAIRSPSETTSK